MASPRRSTSRPLAIGGLRRGGGGCRALAGAAQPAGPGDLDHGVVARIPLGLEPLPASRGVEPPLLLRPRGVASEVQVREQRPFVLRRRGAEGDLTAVAIFVDRARAAVWTREEVANGAPSGSLVCRCSSRMLPSPPPPLRQTPPA